MGPEPFQVRLQGAPAIEVGQEDVLVVTLTVPEPFHVNSATPTFDYLIPTTVTVEPQPGVRIKRTQFPGPKLLRAGGSDTPVSVYDGSVQIRITVQVDRNATPGPRVFRGTLRYQACDDHSCYPPVTVPFSTSFQVANQFTPEDLQPSLSPANHTSLSDTSIAPSESSISSSTPRSDAAADSLTASAASPATSTNASESSLPLLLLFAFLGGLLLNLMPCVLPVLSLKIMGLLQHAHESRGRAATLGLAYVFGVLVSFWTLAGVVLAARSAGSAVGWGFQFQNTTFIAMLSGLVTAFALSLFGVFELNLPGSAGSRMASAAAREGLPGAFLGGVFATLLATPCTAPFLGAAMGFAFTQPAPVLVAFFTSSALGLALPYLLLVLSPGLRRILPRPGAWMERLKQSFGFLMLATLLWLWFVLGQQAGPVSIVLVAAWNLLTAFALWASFAAAGLESSSLRRFAARLLLVAAVTVGWFLLVRPAIAERAVASAPPPAPGAAIPAATWIPYDPAVLERLRAEGRTVFVDATADWCLTCKVNERAVLKTDRGMELFREKNVVLMVADWTVEDPVVTEFLSRFGRAGVPFYAIYPGDAAPITLPEILTFSILEDALERAATPPSGPA